MIHDDWPLWGDAGDLFRADPTGHVRHTVTAVLDTIWATFGVPPPDKTTIDAILEGL